jgi:DNA modification methylase
MINQVFNESCLVGLPKLPEKSIHCCITSPPYYGLRDYGHGDQIGLEETPEQYVAKIVEVFREVKRVLRDDGTIWLNLGDSYWGGGWRGAALHENSGDIQKGSKGTHCGESLKKIGTGNSDTYKTKDLIGIPWMVAFALRSDGWYLRQDIIWHKPNPMPESVTDRCTKAHEYIFLLSKSQKYYYDNQAIKYPMQIDSMKRNQSGWNGNEGRSYVNGKQNNMSKYLGSDKAKEDTMANKRSVWTVTTKSFSDAHFATFPEDLIMDCIKAGCPEGGIILDPFMGAFTTALMARKLYRNYIGYEINPEYIAIGEKRLSQELGMFR